MKKISKFIVECIMDTLIYTNSKTTTLDVKNHLRTLGYLADQKEVSDFMQTISADAPFKYERNNSDSSSYFTYVFVPTLETAKVADTQDASTSTSGIAATDVTIDPTTVSIPGSSVVVKKQDSGDDKREPFFVFYTKSTALASAPKVPTNTWVVTTADGNSEIHFYESELTRDLVRSRYTTKTKNKIQNVRACRVTNFGK